MNSEPIIREQAAKMGLVYKFGPLPYLNQALDAIVHDKAKDAVYCLNIQATDGSFNFRPSPYYRRAVETQRVQIALCGKIALDYDPQDVEALVGGLKAQAVELANSIESAAAWEPLTNITYRVMFDAFDANLVVVLLSFDATEIGGKCID